MREAVIILPKTKNDGSSASSAHQFLRTNLLRAFQGYSRSECTGSWIDDGIVYDDESYMYTVAAAPGAENDEVLRIFACAAAVRAGQEAIYYRDFTGHVSIMKPREQSPAFAAAAELTI